MEKVESINNTTTQNFQLPPGFRFHPSDEELIVHYLRNKVTSCPLLVSVAAEIDLYNYNPWELPKKALFGEGEWYFFSHRERKYPKGERPKRAAGSGYWKASGIDQPIFSSVGSKQIGVKNRNAQIIRANMRIVHLAIHEQRLISTAISTTSGDMTY